MYSDLKKDFEIKADAVILAIESSCDETAAAVVKGGREILSSEIISSASEHVRFGGVVPEIASRAHTFAISLVVERAIAAAGITLRDIDAVAVTYGSGLLGALLVGVSYAKTLAYSLSVPLVPVSHIRVRLRMGRKRSETVQREWDIILLSPDWGEAYKEWQTL